MNAIEIRNIEQLPDKNLTLASYFVKVDGEDKENATYDLEGQLTNDEVLAKVKEMNPESEVTLNLTGQTSDAGGANSKEGLKD